MSEQCNHACGSCGEQCTDRQAEQTDFRVKPHPQSRVGKVVAVMSGKGGVGKSLVTALLATGMTRRGRQSAILDADITGPSIPKIFGQHGKARANESGLLPVRSKGGVEMMSMNLLLPGESDAVIWRGPIIGGVVKQFWSEVIWQDVDYMFVDMPPGTGDVPLTVFQSLPVDGIIIVASPQELVGMIVEKAVNMANMMNIPVLGIVENMSWIACPDCGKKIYPFGEGKTLEVAQAHSLPLLAQLPIQPELASACDKGMVELFNENWLDGAADVVEHIPEHKAE